MTKKILSIMLALFAIATTAKAEIAICGLTITDELAAQGNLVPIINEAKGVTATGTITYDAATLTLVLENATIETNIHDNIIRFLGGKYTVQLKGSNSLSTTSVNPSYAAIMIGYSSDDVTITGEGSLSVFSEFWYSIQLSSGLLTIDNTTVTANGGGGGICYNNSKGGSLVLKKANVKAKSIHRLSSIELVDCAIVEPEGAAVQYDDGMNSYYVGVNDDWAFDIVISSATTGIGSVSSEATTDNRYYTVDGVKLSTEPKKKGVYIRNGKKVVK